MSTHQHGNCTGTCKEISNTLKKKKKRLAINTDVINETFGQWQDVTLSGRLLTPRTLLHILITCKLADVGALWVILELCHIAELLSLGKIISPLAENSQNL